MVEEVRMPGPKREKIVNGLRDSINIFLIKNIDVLGFCHVAEIDLADDLKSARIFIGFVDNKDNSKSIKYISKNINGIFNEYNKMYSSKNFPSLRIFSFNDELSI